MNTKSRAAIYARISKDAVGDEAGVTRQLADCRKTAKLRGWEVVGEYVDNDLSASNRRVTRPQYNRLVADFQAGAFEVLLCWDLDRLTRQPRQLEDWIDAAEERGLKLVTANGEADLTTHDGIVFAGIKAQIARSEIKQKAARQKAANKQRVEQGKYLGTRRPFGYRTPGKHPQTGRRDGTITVDPVEAPALLAAYHHVREGGSVAQIAREWNAAGLGTTQEASRWLPGTVARVLRGGTPAGFVMYHGQVSRDADTGERLIGDWEPIVPLEVWEDVQAILADPRRRTAVSRTSDLLLTGVATCGVCGGTVWSGGFKRGHHRYRCGSGLQHVTRYAEPIERYVEDVVLAYLERADVRAAYAKAAANTRKATEVDRIRGEVEAVERRRVEMASAFADGAVNIAQLRAFTSKADAQIAALEAKLPNTSGGAAVGSLVTSGDPRRVWASMAVLQRREALRELVRVAVLPVGSGHSTLVDPVSGQKVARPETVSVEWL